MGDVRPNGHEVVYRQSLVFISIFHTRIFHEYEVNIHVFFILLALLWFLAAIASLAIIRSDVQVIISLLLFGFGLISSALSSIIGKLDKLERVVCPRPSKGQ